MDTVGGDPPSSISWLDSTGQPGSAQNAQNAQNAQDKEALQSALAHRGPGLRFDKALEQAYERDTGERRGRRIFFCSLLGTLIFGLLASYDLRLLSHAADTLKILIAAVLVFCGSGLLWQWIHLRRLSPMAREWISSVGITAVSAYVAIESNQARDVLSVMIGSHLMAVFVFVCLVARLRFPFTLMVTTVSLVAYAVAASAYDALTQAIVLNYLVLFVGAAVISLAGNYLLERKERRAYLMQRLSALHRDAVQAKAEVLNTLSLRDPLTKLPNRRHFDREIGQLWRGEAVRDGRVGLVGPMGPVGPVGLLQVDVDFFKLYNDSYGHPMGDVCLQRISASLADVARAHGGLAARIGGEEFAVLLPGLDLAGASVVAQRLCQTVRSLKMPHRTSAAAPCVTISVGVASMRPTEADRPATLMLAADLALYRAKREGRNRSALATQAPATRESGGAALAPPEPSPDPTEAPGRAASANVERLDSLLVTGLRKLRFPPDIEADYQALNGLRRQRELALVVVAGMLVTCLYVWISLPLHADIASGLMRGTFVLCGGLALPWLLVLQRPMPWRWREGLFAATTSVLSVGLVAMAAQGHSPGSQSSMLSLSLITIVSTLIAAPPIRFNFPTALLLFVCIATLTWHSEPADQARWVSLLSILSVTSIYSLVGAYSLDLSNRRSYLLSRLSEAQIAELQRINADLRRLALTDTLTGLPNRRHFESRLSALWKASRSTNAPLALLIIDIDHFKAYNDGYGHLAGDECLQSVAGFIADWCAAQTSVTGKGIAAFAARLGGEEFGVLMPGLDTPSALAAAGRLCASLHGRRSPHAYSPVADVLTASIGTASQRVSDAQERSQLLRSADEALYRAKTGGRNRASA